MQRPSSQALAILVSLLAAVAVLGALARPSVRHRPVEAGFWFEEIALDSTLMAPPLTDDDLRRIESTARYELSRAFAGLRIGLSDRRDARYRLRVVMHVQDLRFKRQVGVAGESRAVTGFGGSGSISFWFLANGAIANAPDGANRQTVVDAIGRGIGRTAVHELTHLLLPKAPIHDSVNTASYEYRSAARPEHYYGRPEWDLAWPLLATRLGRANAMR